MSGSRTGTTALTIPCFSPEAQETFVVGARVFVRQYIFKVEDFERAAGIADAAMGGAKGTFLGWLGEDELNPRVAVVDYDDLGVHETSFENLRNLYR